MILSLRPLPPRSFGHGALAQVEISCRLVETIGNAFQKLMQVCNEVKKVVTARLWHYFGTWCYCIPSLYPRTLTLSWIANEGQRLLAHTGSWCSATVGVWRDRPSRLWTRPKKNKTDETSRDQGKRRHACDIYISYFIFVFKIVFYITSTALILLSWNLPYAAGYHKE